MILRKLCLLGIALAAVWACDTEKEEIDQEQVIEVPKIMEEYGFVLNDFEVVRDTIRSGDTFGNILNDNHVAPGKIFSVVETIKDSLDVRRIKTGRPYVLLNSKDTIGATQIFIYEQNRVDYTVVDMRDTVAAAFTRRKPVTYVEKTAGGIITSSLSETMSSQGLGANMTERLANVYAWTVNFFHLQNGDNFKVIYTEKYINDSIPAGIDEIKAAYFEHRGRPIYAFNFVENTELNIADFYDEEANNLRRAFLKSPIKFNYRISSKYNLKRRIKYYGYKVRAHKGTDFAASIGTPILATADGTVTKSERRGGNGNYVKIKHNTMYETQYLHMKKRNVRAGDFVRQGDVIGWVGMTGNTGGPHVCYRFWKNGSQVDPFLQDLPASKPLIDSLRPTYFKFIAPLKDQLDCVSL